MVQYNTLPACRGTVPVPVWVDGTLRAEPKTADEKNALPARWFPGTDPRQDCLTCFRA
jgi:hypothetical protein